MSPIDSSMFSHHDYDPASRTMTLRFKNGAVWHYDGVSPEKNAAFLAAPSKGQHFNTHIRGIHPGQKA
jgi:hypothetical protein